MGRFQPGGLENDGLLHLDQFERRRLTALRRTAPSGNASTSSRVPGRHSSRSRTRLGMTTWPLLVSLVELFILPTL
jgi:hypothetical protein